jgi:hypothetical protein
MDFIVGAGPDFVMRHGMMEVFHGAIVRAVNDAGVEIFHESTSDRSLWVVAKVVAAYLRANGIGEDEGLEISFAGIHAEFNLNGKVVSIKIRLPEKLPLDMRDWLILQFEDFIRNFFKIQAPDQ